MDVVYIFHVTLVCISLCMCIRASAMCVRACLVSTCMQSCVDVDVDVNIYVDVRIWAWAHTCV